MTTIKLNGKDYDWNFKFKAQMKLEEISGKNSIQIVDIIRNVKETGLPFKFVLQIAFCGLSSKNKDLTIEAVEDILDNGTSADLLEVIQRYNSDMGTFLGIKSIPNEESQAV